MSRGSRSKRKKGVRISKVQTQAHSRDVQQDAVPIGDIYQGVVASLGFDPIKEAEERRRLA